MSSLAATQSDGYYLPPEYFESGAYKKQGKNAWYKNQEQSKASSALQPKGVVVRFELVDPCVCESCGTRIGKGTRFNTTKEKVGAYLGSPDCPIYEFRTKCRVCSHPFSLRTDPATRGFAYGPGIRRQERSWDAQDVHGPFRKHPNSDKDEDDKKNVVHQLEKQVLGKIAAKTEFEELQALQTLNRRVYEKDADMNANLRRVSRQHRNERKERKRQASSKGWSRKMTLLPTSVADSSDAAEQTFGPSVSVQQQIRWKRTQSSSIFANVRHSPAQKRKRGNTLQRYEQSEEAVSDHVRPEFVHSTTSSIEDRSRKRSSRKSISLVDLTVPCTKDRPENDASLQKPMYDTNAKQNTTQLNGATIPKANAVGTTLDMSFDVFACYGTSSDEEDVRTT